jgi:hypothetical protein
MAEFVRARESFTGAALDAAGNSVQVDVFAGKTYRTSHPGYAGREHLFEPLDDGPPAPQAEQAPAATGRGRGRAAE